jgi:hypothetical protein
VVSASQQARVTPAKWIEFKSFRRGEIHDVFSVSRGGEFSESLEFAQRSARPLAAGFAAVGSTAFRIAFSARSRSANSVALSRER